MIQTTSTWSTTPAVVLARQMQLAARPWLACRAPPPPPSQRHAHKDSVRLVDAKTVREMLPWRPLVDALREGFAQGASVPLRHHHCLDDRADANTPTLLVMPAWSESYLGVKVVSVFPANRGRSDGVPTINGTYLLMSGQTGQILAAIDGGELTARRTAAASGLAACSLARPDSSRLVVVGSGRLARNLAEAYSVLFPISQVTVWNHRFEGAERLAAALCDAGIAAVASADLEASVGSADIVTCATLASDPVVRGAWLPGGCHVDLVGGFTPGMREADDDAVMRSTVYVDTRAGAMAEAGDIVQSIASGSLREGDIAGDLFDLSKGQQGRSSTSQITLFKSVGHAIEDLSAAALVYRGLLGKS